jgi:hypothetical protein
MGSIPILVVITTIESILCYRGMKDNSLAPWASSTYWSNTCRGRWGGPAKLHLNGQHRISCHGWMTSKAPKVENR